MKTIIKLLAVSAISLVTTAVSAATVSLVPGSATVDPGGSIGLDLVLNAPDEVVPGSSGEFSGLVTIIYDPTQVSFDSFGFQAPAFSTSGAPIIAAEGSLERVSLGFGGAADIGTIGTYNFTALAGEGAEIAFDFVAAFSSGFANESPTNKPFIPELVGGSVSVVPIPASAWLLLSGFGVLAGIARRRRA